MSEIAEKFYIEHDLTANVSFKKFNDHVIEKLKEMDGLCDEETSMKLVLKDLGIKPVKVTRYVYRSHCPSDDGEEVIIPDDAIGIMHWVDNASDVDIYPVLSWYEPVRDIKGLTVDEINEMERENIEFANQWSKRKGFDGDENE